MTAHGANGVDEGRRAVGPVISSEATLKVDFTEKHVYRVNPGEVQIEKMPNENLTSSDCGPLDFYSVRSPCTAKSVFLLIVFLKILDHVDEASLG